MKSAQNVNKTCQHKDCWDLDPTPTSCIRKVWPERPEDGYCKRHHPETVAARFAEQNARDKARWALRDAKRKVLEARRRNMADARAGS